MHSKKPDCYFNLGNAYLLKEEYKKAMKSFKKCIELDATNSTAIYNLGNTYFISGDKDKAITYFEKADQWNQTIVNGETISEGYI